MDLHTFCVDRGRKVSSPYRLLRTSAGPKMSASFHFPGVPVGDALFEDPCFAHFETMPYETQIDFHGVTQKDHCGSRKSCLDHKFPTIAFSKLVGGFVGSKSQCGASKEPHQVWDVILRQVVETNSRGSLKNNVMDCVNIGKSVSGTFFGPFCKRSDTLLDTSITYFFANHCDLFESKKMVNNPPPEQSYSKSMSLDKTCDLEFFHNSQSAMRQGSYKEACQGAPRQSYAEVAKSFATKKTERFCKEIESMGFPNSSVLTQNAQCGIKRGNRRSKKEVNNADNHLAPSHCSSQNQHVKKSTHCIEEPMHMSKFPRDRKEHIYKCVSQKCKIQDVNSLTIDFPIKDKNLTENRRPRHYKTKKYNLKMKEKKSIGQQVQEDASFLCNDSELKCKNWRCRHNRVKPINSRSESRISMDQCPDFQNICEYKKYIPPITAANPSVENVSERSTKQILQSCVGHSECFQAPKDVDTVPSISSRSSQDLVGGSCSDSSFLSTLCIGDGLPARPRIPSECSVDSEESIVFEADAREASYSHSNNTVEDWNNNSESFDEEESDCDEVDFTMNYPDPYTSSWLQTVNSKWQENNTMVPKGEKISKKIHFAPSRELVKVYPMVKWDFAYRNARCGPWEQMARDRCRFKTRIERMGDVLSHVLSPQHRRKVWEERICRTAVT